MVDAESPAPPSSRSRRRLLQWVPVVLCALLLGAASQVLWMWESWPVRELLRATQIGPSA
jgi:hypothetical protein